MKSPSAHLFVLKSPSYIMMLLSFASSCIAATETQTNDSRDLKMTQAQRFASVKNPRVISMEQFKAQLNSNQQAKGDGSNSKLSLALGEALSLNGAANGADRKGGHGDRTTIIVGKNSGGTGTIKDKTKKDQMSNGKDGDTNNIFISKFSAALGEAMDSSNDNNRDVDTSEKHMKKSGDPSDLEGRSSALPQGS
jgi:hypothetical protein